MNANDPSGAGRTRRANGSPASVGSARTTTGPSARPPAQCFLSSDPNWTLYPGNNGFKPMTAIAGGKIPGTQCTYAPNAFTGNGKFCP